MQLLIVGVIAILLLVGLAALASGFGVDSRDQFEDSHRSAYPVTLS